MMIKDLSIRVLLNAYRNQEVTPSEVVDSIHQRASLFQDRNIWIHLLSMAEIQPYLDRLATSSIDDLPLYGIPFAIKDNIDLAGIPTTAACPAYSYVPSESAFVIQKLIEAGALPIGKTNMDQFATGLVGTRSPFGAVKNGLNPEYISGGSSSGSAVATSLGLVSFALGTDTAGSGRIPAMFNNLIGFKPSCGIISSRGVVPACRTIDCVSLFGLNPDDIEQVWPVISQYDARDEFSRRAAGKSRSTAGAFRFGTIPVAQRQNPENAKVNRLLQQFEDHLVSLGGIPVPIEFTPFRQAAELLYEGPWVAERYTTVEKLLAKSPESLLPVTRTIISTASRFSAADAFKASYRLRKLKRQTDEILSTVDFILTPTASTIHTIQDVENDPIRLNSNLGFYTNFMNLLDYSAISLPAGLLDNGMPFGITLFADKFQDGYLIRMSQRVLSGINLKMGATGFCWSPVQSTTSIPDSERIDLMVCGAHLSGMPLNRQLTDLGAVLVKATTTASCYRLYALAGGPPLRPGLVRSSVQGSAIDVEVWSIPLTNLGFFLKNIPSPLGLGKVELIDGSLVTGFICEPHGIQDALDITAYGGWINYLNSLPH